MEPVEFEITLGEEAKPYMVKSNLEKLADDFALDIPDMKGSVIHGSTSQETYESCFGAKLQYRFRRIPWGKPLLLRSDYLSQGLYEWVEVKPAQSPFKDDIKEIVLAEAPEFDLGGCRY